MALARVVDWEACAAECGEQGDEAWDQRLEARYRVALGVEVAADGEEVALHVDYEEGGCGGVEGGIVWPWVGEGCGDLGCHFRVRGRISGEDG